MLGKLLTVFKIPELRRKIFLTLVMLAVYRMGFAIPLPFINQVQMNENMKDLQQEGGGVGQSNQNDPTLHFGLGKHAGQVRFIIEWPNGKRQSGTSKVDRMFRVKMDTQHP